MVYLLILFINSSFAQAPPDLVTLCVQNAKKELKNKQQACECAVNKTFETITKGDYKDKNPTKRINWYKDMLGQKLSQAEIDDDRYSIWEFNYHHSLECLKNN